MSKDPKKPTATAAPDAGLRARYVCFAGCQERYPLDEVHHACAACGGLLDVEHDLDALRRRGPPAAWRALFEERWLRPGSCAGGQSGVWGKREWICPEVADEHVVSLGEGMTALVPMPTLGRALGIGPARLLVKQCGHGPTGSFKDLGMTVLLSMVTRMRGQGVPIPAVACASTGDTSAALSAYAARAGVPALVFLPAGRISDEQLVQAIAGYAITVSLDTDFDGCMRLVAEFCSKHGVYLANSMNPLRTEGQKSIAFEVCQQLGWEAPEWIVVPGGNLGNVTAIGKGLRMLKTLGLLDRLPRLVVAQAAHAAPLYRAFRDRWRYQPVAARPTQASAIQIGAPVNVHKAIATLRDFAGLVDVATEEELAAACALGDRHGLYTDPHTGVALAVAAKLGQGGLLAPGDRVVVISTAHGLKFSGLKRAYHLAAPSDLPGPLKEVRERDRNLPLALPATLDAAERALLPLLFH